MPDYISYVQFICALLQGQQKGAPKPLSAATDLIADIGLSSLQVMELIEKLEDHFDLSIPLNILPNITTIGDLARSLHNLKH
ncbi:MAG: acyl carrier protein [Porticoccaceae bacterium]